ncbi:MAG: hypothetical protein WC654_03390 [Patescibacteria group bacterium]
MSTQPFQEFLLAFERSNDALCLLVSQQEPTAFVIPDTRGGLAQITIADETSVDDVLSLIADCAKRGRWCRLDVLTSQIDQRLYQALRSISATAHLQALRDGEVVDVLLTAGAKILVVMSDQLVSQITIPTFLNLFGRVFRE